MRLLIISEKYPPIVGGGETHIEQLAIQLSTLGVEVHVLTDFVGEPRMSRDGIIFHEVLSLGAACKKLEFSAAVTDLADVIKAVEPDLVHVFNYVPAMLVSMIRSLVHCPLACTLFETFIEGIRVFEHWKNRFDIEFAMARSLSHSLNADVQICGSQSYVEWIAHVGFAEPVELVKFGIDVEYFEKQTLSPLDSRKSIGVPLDVSILLVPARPIARKRIKDVIEATSQLLGSGQRVHLLLCEPDGRSDEAVLAELHGLIEHLQLEEHCSWLRGMDWKAMSAAYIASDIVVLPASDDGMGICLIEAMASGRPIVTSRVPGHMEAIIDGHTGLAYEVGNISEMTHAITRILCEQGLADRLRRGGLERVRAEFSLQRVSTDHLRIYQSLIQKS